MRIKSDIPIACPIVFEYCIHSQTRLLLWLIQLPSQGGCWMPLIFSNEALDCKSHQIVIMMQNNPSDNKYCVCTWVPKWLAKGSKEALREMAIPQYYSRGYLVQLPLAKLGLIIWLISMTLTPQRKGLISMGDLNIWPYINRIKCTQGSSVGNKQMN